MIKNNAYLALVLPLMMNASHPTFIELYNKGVELHKSNPSKAIEYFSQSLDFEPNSIEAHYNVAYLLRESNQFAQALPHYEFILKSQPQHAAAHLGRAIINLAFGNYECGWPEFEWHLGSPAQEDAEHLKKLLKNNLSLENKIVLLRAEWGAGDTIQMIRYAKLLHEKGAYVVVHLLHQSLVPLFEQQPFIDKVVPPSQPSPPYHMQVPMMNLPSIFNTNLESVPAEFPYISIDPQLVNDWKIKLANDKTFKIGICWKGNYIHGEEKFMPLSYLAQLAAIPGISLYSLQRIHGLDQLEELENKDLIKTFDATFDAVPFLDTAAVMKNLDLIITVDTSIAHLAGALNVPVWMILPQKSDWRWMLDRIDTPWYKSMRLFRQQKQGEWQPLLEHIIHALKEKSRSYC